MLNYEHIFNLLKSHVLILDAQTQMG